jgi:hypothetical protein
MESKFTKRVRELYEVEEKIYMQNRHKLYESQEQIVSQLLYYGQITPEQCFAYLRLFKHLRSLSFENMVAYRAQIADRTVRRVINETKYDELAEWSTVAAILQAAGVDQQELWELNLLYLYEIESGVRKKTRSVVNANNPATDPFGRLGLLDGLAERQK